LGGLALLKELTCHAGLSNRNCHAALELLADVRFAEVGRLWDDDVLATVVVRRAVSKVLRLLDGRFPIALVEVGDDGCVEVLNFLFERRQGLDSKLKKRATFSEID